VPHGYKGLEIIEALPLFEMPT
jgi:hypothetical protein